MDKKTEEFNDINVEKYADDYSEDGLWKKIKDNVSSIGLNLIYKALQLFYVTKEPSCPMKVKAGIYAALGYFISPIDLIPDFTPIAGYADDATAIGIALVLAQMYINDDVKAKARGKIHDIFGMDALAKLDRDGDKA